MNAVLQPLVDLTMQVVYNGERDHCSVACEVVSSQSLTISTVYYHIDRRSITIQVDRIERHPALSQDIQTISIEQFKEIFDNAFNLVLNWEHDDLEISSPSTSIDDNEERNCFVFRWSDGKGGGDSIYIFYSSVN